MSVVAKFVVNGLTRRSGTGEVDINLSAVVDGSEENKKFFAATPSGYIVLSTVNENAVLQFETGQEYFVTFEKANN